MKILLKTYVISSLLLVALTSQVSAQSRRYTKNKKESKVIISKRIPSTKVKYKKPSRKVVTVRSLPAKTVIKHKGRMYYYANNKYYTRSSDRYIVIAPQVGFRIKVLPSNFKRVHFNSYDYFYANGIFYTQIEAGYEVVEPKVGTIVYELPNDFEKVVINDEIYYEYANILYEKVQVDGTRAYEIVGIIDME
ncbi:DUF6515 family protein [Saccharicrinis fermentans]|uniref:Orphan protein n=1 Tax=Saccharicrinis fermentans DSM 9555 = JCM 21142 TaxID=869213 RepID=W7Y604_9BACT|nr:DUF6515 family protein [Saccharicrinis fermentans]GAF03058.1 hypothetical protein JCM21142_41713 [Saccharicrinis fermentans DSM 9555 = JCM 21142]